MFMKYQCPPGSKLFAKKYRFLKPARLRIRRPNGMVVLEGFGIGETIEVMEYDVRYLVACHEKLDEILMSNGNVIVEYPNDLAVVDLHGFHYL